jgi:hypothetical protein
MKAAGIPGPYFVPSKRYHWKCLAGFAALKPAATMTVNKGSSYLGRYVSYLGFPDIGAAIPAIWRHPATLALFAPSITGEVLDKCECK